MSSEEYDCSSHCHYDAIPSYIWYILGFLLILLLLVSIFLIYVLLKTKYLHIYIINGCKKGKSTSALEKLEAENASTKTWEKKSVRRINLDPNNSDINNEEENNRTLRRQDSAITTVSDFSTLRAPKKPDGSGNISPSIMKAVIKDMPIIKPEQMSQICKEVLKRRNAAEDTTSSLQNIDQLVKEATPEVKIENKFASTPELDVYDVVPSTTREVKVASLEKKKEFPDTSENAVIPNDNTNAICDIYDFPKECKSKALEVSDIYDSPMSSKAPIQSGYVIPYFSSTDQSLSYKEVEEKPKYARIQEISSEPRKSSQRDVKQESNVQEETYDDPKKLIDEPQMYINANDNLFTGSSNENVAESVIKECDKL